MKKIHYSILLLIFLLAIHTGHAQSQQKDSAMVSLNQADNSLPDLQGLPSKYYSKVDKRITSVNDEVTKKSLKYLAKFQRQERRIRQKLQKLDPGLAINNADPKYNELAQKIKSKTAGVSGILSGEYVPNIDSLGNSLAFLNQVKGISNKVNAPLNSFHLLQGNLKESQEIQAFIAERKNQIGEMLSKYTSIPGSLKNQFARLNKTEFYYKTQIQQYKESLKDPKKIEQNALIVLNKIPAFQKFMKEHGQLGNLFGIPAGYSGAQAVQGLQTLDEVRNLVAGRIGSGSGAMQALQSQMQAAQGALNKFKDKLSQLSGGSGNIEMPGFKPGNYKTKPFLQRLEWGTDLQTTRGSYGFPTTTDIGLSVGYKLKNKITVGLGVSYKQGWGKDIQHIDLTSEGMGLRSFFEYQLKKSFYATGGLEYNYQQPFKLAWLTKYNVWQPSGLIGISKVLSIKSKVFKKTRVQFLWDFLSYRQIPGEGAFKFRVGYNF